MFSLSIPTLALALAIAPEGEPATDTADTEETTSADEAGDNADADADADADDAPADDPPEVDEPDTVSASVSTEAAVTTVPVVDTSDAVEPEAKDEPEEKAEETEEKKVKFTPGAHIFLRGEGRFNADFGYNDNAQDVGRVLERARLQLGAEFGPLKAFVQAQDARVWGFEGSPVSNEANTDMHQGYLELGGAKDDLKGWARVGRQEINYGGQRLIGALPWAPNARSFDAVRLHGEYKMFSVDVFGAVLANMTSPVSQEFIIDDTVDPAITEIRTRKSYGSQLLGGTLTGKFHDAINVELILLGQRDGPKNDAIYFDRRIGNVGARIFGEPVKGLKYEVDGNFQWGKNNKRDHRAWAVHADVGYVYGAKPVKPGITAKYNIASGDCTDKPGSTKCADKSQEFFNFHPTNHLFYGFVDLMGWRNMREAVGEISVAYEKLVVLKASYHFLQLHQETGRWANAGGGTIHPGFANNTDNNLGHELDVILVYKPWKPIMIQPGYGIFIPDGAGQNMALGDGGGDLKKSAAQQYLWLWIMATF